MLILSVILTKIINKLIYKEPTETVNDDIMVFIEKIGDQFHFNEMETQKFLVTAISMAEAKEKLSKLYPDKNVIAFLDNVKDVGIE